MDFNKFLTVCVFYTIIGVELVQNLPTLGRESVHIKLHIPYEPPGAGKIKISKQHAPNRHVVHKIIHHYHHNTRSVENLSTKQTLPVLENLLLTELTKPNYAEETFLVKDPPKGDFNNVRIIEEYDGHYKHPTHAEYGDTYTYVGNKKLIEANKSHRRPEPDQQQPDAYDHHIETVEFVDDKPQYVEYNYHAPKEEVIKVIKAPRFQAFLNNNENYGHKVLEKELRDEERNYRNYQSQQKQTENPYQIQYGYQQPVEQTNSKPQEEYQLYQKLEPLMHKFNEPNSHINEPKYVREYSYRKYLPSSENQKQNSIGDASQGNDDQSLAIGNARAVETYKGFDSYSAAHVQGLGSGRYRYHVP